ncbi:MAG: hypothetical protein UX51_C0007G0023 [Candidatus Azambacteria bacterium GW2011_GWF2_46_32]|uniref:Uncharacterized protein n=1 Tax=Candidatus Azambacteria bacterium GW2011_GWF2_46_32 TaxID=1618628 RepID=A0A0G1SXX1_9BACT|nr:MAG: hypothetical protein UX51_C0007G0023 [Candidatus Azambacteria bacterium GW2011_GWF2_46_32]
MSHKTIYIEIDEEITSIIDRIAESEADGLTLAVRSCFKASSI